MERTEEINIKVTPSFKERIIEQCDRHCIEKGQLIEIAVEHFLNKHESQQ